MPARMMRRSRCAIALAALILYAIPSSVGQALAKKHVSKQNMEFDDLALRKQAQDYATAFTACDAQKLANLWSPNGTFVDVNGQEYQGRAAIQDMFVKLFKQIGKQPLSIKVESIRFPAPTVAIEEGSSTIANETPTGHYTVTHVKTDGNWLMEAVTEAASKQADAALPDNKLPRMSWLLGNWTAGGTHLHVDWLPNHNKTFLSCNFTVDPSDSNASRNDDLQIFGWNPRSTQVNVWHYAANGGFGYGRMINTDSQTWIERASSMEPNGTICSATYTFKKINDDTFTWQSTNRNRGQTSLPDLAAVTVKRDGTATK
ncbi:hypothetical protein BH10CYA1_BH10CYA1_42080 [soil metagenome]